MTHGCAHLLTAVFARLGVGAWKDTPHGNVIDGGVPWYRSYLTADGRHMAVGAIEERFYANFVAGLGLDPGELPSRGERARHGELAARFQARFLQAPMAHWAAHFETRDACVTPVLNLHEARVYDVNRGLFDDGHGPWVPAAAPHLFPIQ